MISAKRQQQRQGPRDIDLDLQLPGTWKTYLFYFQSHPYPDSQNILRQTFKVPSHPTTCFLMLRDQCLEATMPCVGILQVIPAQIHGQQSQLPARIIDDSSTVCPTLTWETCLHQSWEAPRVLDPMLPAINSALAVPVAAPAESYPTRRETHHI